MSELIFRDGKPISYKKSIRQRVVCPWCNRSIMMTARHTLHPHGTRTLFEKCEGSYRSPSQFKETPCGS